MILALAACAERSGTTGRVPENTTKERAEFAPAPAPNRQAAYDKRSDEPVDRKATVETPQQSQARVGMASTKVFHRPECELVQDVPAADLVRFTSLWDGIDARYSPCEHCHAIR